jgi:hypothetical protein
MALLGSSVAGMAIVMQAWTAVDEPSHACGAHVVGRREVRRPIQNLVDSEYGAGDAGGLLRGVAVGRNAGGPDSHERRNALRF